MREQETLLQRYLDGEADDEQLRQVEALLAADAELAEFVAASRDIGDLLGQTMNAQAEEVDYSALWAGIEKDVDWYEAGRARALAASAELAGVPEGDVTWRDSFRRILGWKMLSGLAAIAAVFLIVPQLWTQLSRPPSGGGPVGQIEAVAQAPQLRFEGVEVDSVEASESATVMVFQGGEGSATFIWVNEANGDEEQAI